MIDPKLRKAYYKRLLELDLMQYRTERFGFVDWLLVRDVRKITRPDQLMKRGRP